jgi:hypothetical protein
MNDDPLHIMTGGPLYLQKIDQNRKQSVILIIVLLLVIYYLYTCQIKFICSPKSRKDKK